MEAKKLQELTVNVPVKWNENEVAHTKSSSADSSANQKIQKQVEQRETAPADRTFAKEKTSAQKNAEASIGGTNSAFTIGFSKPIDSFTNTSNQTFGVSAAWESGSNSAMINILQLDLFFNNQIHSLLNYDLGLQFNSVFGIYGGGGLGLAFDKENLSSDDETYTFEWKANAGIRLTIKKFVCRIDASYTSKIGPGVGIFAGIAW